MCPRAGSRAGADPPCLTRSIIVVSGSAQGQVGTTWAAGRCLCPWQGMWNEMGFKVKLFCDGPLQYQPAQGFCRKQGVKENSPAKPFGVLGRKVPMDSKPWRSQGHPMLSSLKAPTSDFSFV